MIFLEGFYSVHVKVRYLHDRAYQGGPRWYKNWSDKSYSSSVHKTALWGFVTSFLFFTLAQSIFPYLFSLKPHEVYAGSNSRTWTTNGDFHYNKSTICGQTTHDAGTVITGSDYTDATCTASAADAELKLKMLGSLEKTTVGVGSSPAGVGVNSTTNKIYVANDDSNSLSVVDGVSNSVSATVNLGTDPWGVAVNKTTNKIYVSNKGSNTLAVVDGTNNTVATNVTVQTMPYGVAVNETTNKIYVANYVSNTVSVIDGSNNTVVTNITVGSAPAGIAVNEVTNKIYVTNYSSNNVSVIDGTNNTVSTTVTVGTGPNGVAVNPTTNTIFVANYFGPSVSVINGDTNTVTTTITTNITPYGVVVDAALNRIYVSTRDSSGLTVINGVGNAILATVPVAGNPFGFAVGINTTTKMVYISGRNNSLVTIVDSTNDIPVSTVNLLTSPEGVAVNEATNKVFVAHRTASGKVQVYNASNNSLEATVTTGSTTYGVAANPITNKIYASNFGSANVSIIDGTNNTVSGTVNVGTGPWGVAVNKVTNKIYVANRDTDNVSIINGVNNAVTNVTVGDSPIGVTVNHVTNKIYVAQANGVAVIDGASGTVTGTIISNAARYIAVNTVTNKIYASAWTVGQVTVIDGATDTVTTSIATGSNAYPVAVNEVTNKIYVGNNGANTITVISGDTNTIMSTIYAQSPNGIAVNNEKNLIYAVSGNASYKYLSIINKYPSYSSSGITAGLKVDAGAGMKASWTSLSWNVVTPSNTSVKFNARTSDDNSGWSAWSADLITPGGSSISGLSKTRYLEIQATLASTDGVSTPTLSDATVNYDTLNAPTDLAQYKTDNTSQINAGSYANETSVKLKADIGTPFANSSPVTPQFEVRTADSGWTGSPATPAGVTATATQTTYTCAANPCTALGVKDIGILTGLSNGTYYYRTRTTDAAGRISAWSATSTAFNVDVSAPTASVSINEGNRTSSTNVHLTINAADTGGSGLSTYELSNDGTSWSAPISISGNSYTNSNVSWTLSSGDGLKTVYLRTRDSAGNYNGWRQDSESQFDGIKTNTVVAGGTVALGPTPPDQVAWINGINSLSYLQVAPPVPVTIDYAGQWDYASTACSDLGGRLPTLVEMRQMSIDVATYGPYSAGQRYYSSTESGGNVWTVTLSSGQEVLSTKDFFHRYRCVREIPGAYSPNGSYVSTVKNMTGVANFGNASWLPISQPVGTSVTVQVRAGNTASPDGSWTVWNTVNNNESLSSINGKQYLQYQLAMSSDSATHNLTPTIESLNIDSYAIATTSSDATPPSDVANLKAYNDSGKGTEYGNDTWHSDTSVYFEWDATSDSGVGIGGYKYCLSNSATCNPTIDLGNTTNYSATITDPDERKYFRVVAYDLVNNQSATPATFIYGFDDSAPTAVTDVTASSSYDTYVRVQWNAVNDPAAPISYAVERIKNSVWEDQSYQLQDVEGKVWSSASGYGKKMITGTPPSNFYNDSTAIPPDMGATLEAGLKYVYRVHVIDSVGNEGPYQALPVFGWTRDTGNPSTPTNVSASACSYQNPEYCSDTNNALKGHEIKLTWLPGTDAGSGIAKYLIYRATAYSTEVEDYTVVGVKTVPIPLPGGFNMVYYDNDAANDATDPTYKPAVTPHLNDYVTYYYRIRAVDAADPANLSEFVPTIVTDNAAMVRTPDVTAPTVPSGLTAGALGLDGDPIQPGQEEQHQKVQVNWAASVDTGSGVAAYRIYRSDAANGTYTEITNDPSVSCNFTTRGCTQKGLTDFTTYYYKIKAIDGAPYLNESGLSAYVSVRTASGAVPTSPLGPLNESTGLKYDQPRVITETGDPNSNSEVGHKNTITFSGSYSKNCDSGIRCIVGYEIYRAATNFATNEEWKDTATKIIAFSVDPIKEDRDTIYTYVDNDVNNDATSPNLNARIGQNNSTITGVKTTTPKLTDTVTYYYKVRVIDNTPADPDGGPFEAYSTIALGNLHSGWDTTADATAPALPSDLKVKDIHDDGMNYKRNIITWARIATPTRNSVNDFKEYRIYRSNDGLAWQQICQDGAATTLQDTCDAQNPNPLYNSNKEIGLATNYFMDLIPIADANQYYYYYVTAADDAGQNFKYPDNSVINNISNESKANIGSNGAIASVSLNPAIAKPSICDLGSNPCISTDNVIKATLADVGVSTATISWATDQATDSIVEFKRSGTSDAFIGTIDRAMGTTHQVTIKPLLPNTTYQYRIISRNSLANDAIAEGVELPTLTTTGFNVTAGAVVTTTSTAEINWTTNLDASSAFVEYQLQRQPGDEAQGGTSGVEPNVLAESPRSHKVIVKGLRSNRTYTYKVKSISKDGFLSEHPAGSFATFKTKSYDSEQFTLAPSSSNVAERNITSTTAQIIWQTSGPTTSWVDYGTKSGIYDVSAGDNNLTTSHVVMITGLVPGTKYYYRVRVKDANEVEFTSMEYSFTAVLKPKIDSLTISNVTPYSVTISWNTNVDTETLMNWGTTTAYGQKRGNATVGKIHSVTIDNLEDNTEYHYQILAHDQAGNEVADEDKILRTPLDTNGPKITDVKNDIILNEADNTAQVIISWKTDKPATTLVQYDEGVIGGKYSKSTVEDLGLSNTHTVIIKDLAPGITYHYRIVTKDRRNNETISNDYNFITPTAEKSILQLILKSLEETFSWIGNLGKFFNNIGKKVK